MVYLRAPDHDVASLCQWRSSERTYCSAQNITHFCTHIDPAFGSDRNEWIHAFRKLQEPANRFRVCEGKRSFRRSRKAGKKKRSRSGPTEQEMLPAKDERISLKNLTKPDYSMSAKSFFRDRQTDGRSRTSEDSTIIDAVPTPLLDQSCPESLSDELRDHEHASATRCNVQHWVDRKCLGAFCVTCTWFDTHRRGFRDRLSAVRLAPRGSRDALWGNSRISPSLVEQKEMGNESIPTLWAVLERHDDLQLAKTKTNKTFQPAKSDQIFV